MPNHTATQTRSHADVPAEASGFTHLHLHSEFSLLDGGNRIDRLVDRVKQLGMEAVALTDHGNLHGAVPFYAAAKKAGIKPILGIEAYVAPDVDGKPSDRTNREYTGVSDGGFHLVLLAENHEGWRHLLKLSSDAFLDGFYFKPRMDKTTLAQWSKGLIAINGHLGSSLAHHLNRYVRTNDPTHFNAAVAEAQWHKQTFGVNADGEPNFFIELQRHDTPEQDQLNPHLIEIARRLDLPLVCDNDAHFLLADDWDAHDTLCCISMGKLKEETNRLTYPKQLYVKSPDEMKELFSDLPEAVVNTQRIAERCNVELDFSANHAPVVKIVRHETARGDDGEPIDEATLEKGSTDWFKAFCSRYELQPFDATRDDLSADDLKQQCDEALRELCEAGLIWRYGEDGVTDEIRARLERELGILADKNISAYFLIVWDFVNEGRRRGVPCNARGSGVGTMVGYVLGLSNACPVNYGLLFERFTDPDRSEYPDIDIDMCQDGRQDILEYVRQKYGYVAQIITFGTLKARAAIRDVGRVLNVPLSEVDKVCKLVGDGLGVTLDQALDQEPDLKTLYQQNPSIRNMIDTARRLEGLSRHAGIHAAGVVLATEPLDHIVPLYRQGSDPNLPVVTQWDGPTCEKLGLLKMDFLGLRTLSIIERAKQLVRETLTDGAIQAAVHGPVAAEAPAAEPPEPPERLELSEPSEPATPATSSATDTDTDTDSAAVADPLDLERLAFNDQAVFDLFRRGETGGVFQFESGGMRNLLMAMKPDRLEDLIAANALYRPGPMDLIPDYVDRKHGRQPVPDAHPIVQKFTDETYGIMVYQEQVMQIVHELGGIPLRQAYTLIKAISKKKHEVIDANREKFVEGAKARGLSESNAQELFELILKFAGYGFNKSHSTGYAIVAYQTAYLKTYFPVQYMAAVLTYESVSTDKVVQYIDECKRVMFPNGKRGVEVRPPDVNLSDVAFTVVFDEAEPRDANHGHIRFGLSAVKGVGEKAIRAITKERDAAGPFTSLYDFCERVPLGQVNRATIEALIKCGAFDSLHGIDQRAAMLEAVEDAIKAGSQVAADRSSGQMNFFGAFEEVDPKPAQARTIALPSVEPWDQRELLEHEMAVMGLYVSSHPLEEHQDDLARFSNTTLAQIKQLQAGVEVVVGGILSRVRPTVVKNGRSAGQKMAMFTLEDQLDSVEGVVFSDAYAVAAPILQKDEIVFIKGKVDRRREEAGLIAEEVIPVDEAASRLTRSVRIVLRGPKETRSDHARPYNGELAQLDQLLKQQSRQGGSAEVHFEIHQDQRIVQLRLEGVRIRVDRDLPERVATVLHESPGCCRLQGPPKIKRHDAQADASATSGGRAVFSSAAQGEAVCASVDRY